MKFRKFVLALLLIISFRPCRAEVEQDLDQLMETGRKYRWDLYDFKNASKIFKIGAEKGHPVGLSEYGSMLIDGVGPVETNRALGYQMIRKAAELGEVEAQYSLGYYLINGGISHEQYDLDGNLKPGEPQVEKDVEKGLSLYREASEKGHHLATYRLGQFYLYQFLYDDLTKEEKERSKIEAIKWLTKGVEMKSTDCASMLADSYLIGLTFEQNTEKAKYYYELAYGSVFTRSIFKDIESHIAEIKSKY